MRTCDKCGKGSETGRIYGLSTIELSAENARGEPLFGGIVNRPGMIGWRGKDICYECGQEFRKMIQTAYDTFWEKPKEPEVKVDEVLPRFIVSY